MSPELRTRALVPVSFEAPSSDQSVDRLKVVLLAN